MLTFIVGTGRSGTNLLRDLLNAHPLFYIPQETHWIPTHYDMFGLTRNPFSSYVDVIIRTFYDDGIRILDYLLDDAGVTREDFLDSVAARLRDAGATDVIEANSAIYDSLVAFKGKSWSGDKTPEYGFYMSLLQQLWPDCRFLHVVRDGRDVALSMSRHSGFRRMLALGITNWIPASFYAPPPPPVPAWVRRRRDAVERLPTSARRVLRALMPPRRKRSHPSPVPFMRLWETRIRRIRDEATRVAPGTLLEVRYERLVDSPEVELPRIADFLALPQDSAWVKAASGLVRRGGPGRRLDPTLHREMTTAAEVTLREFGYS
jgi:hypothetical protein